MEALRLAQMKDLPGLQKLIAGGLAEQGVQMENNILSQDDILKGLGMNLTDLQKMIDSYKTVNGLTAEQTKQQEKMAKAQGGTVEDTLKEKMAKAQGGTVEDPLKEKMAKAQGGTVEDTLRLGDSLKPLARIGKLLKEPFVKLSEIISRGIGEPLTLILMSLAGWLEKTDIINKSFTFIVTLFTRIIVPLKVIGKMLGKISSLGRVFGRLFLPLTILFTVMDAIKGVRAEWAKFTGETSGWAKFGMTIFGVIKGIAGGIVDAIDALTGGLVTKITTAIPKLFKKIKGSIGAGVAAIMQKVYSIPGFKTVVELFSRFGDSQTDITIPVPGFNSIPTSAAVAPQINATNTTAQSGPQSLKLSVPVQIDGRQIGEALTEIALSG